MSASDSKPVRIERTFYPDGSPKAEVHYRGESCHGPWREWHENGVLAREWKYDRHVFADGAHRTWHDNGRLESVHTYRGGRLVEEINYNKGGKRVPSLYEKRLGAERAFIERAAAQARVAKPPKSRRRISPEDASRHGAFVEEMLASRTAPARQWLLASSEAARRTLGELDHAVSAFLVETLHDLGALEVLAVQIEADNHQPAQTTNHVLVVLPRDPDARARLIAFEKRWARRGGFASQGDWGQGHVYLMLG